MKMAPDLLEMSTGEAVLFLHWWTQGLKESLHYQERRKKGLGFAWLEIVLCLRVEGRGTKVPIAAQSEARLEKEEVKAISC